MTKAPIAGSCLCGTVSYSITGDIGVFQYCQCSRCRKFTGSAFAANLFVKPDDFQWLSGEDTVGRYAPDNTKYFTTAFCKKCGSSLPWSNKSGSLTIIPAGTLDQPPEIRPQRNIFCASQADWYVEPGNLPKFDELPPRK